MTELIPTSLALFEDNTIPDGAKVLWTLLLHDSKNPDYIIRKNVYASRMNKNRDTITLYINLLCDAGYLKRISIGFNKYKYDFINNPKQVLKKQVLKVLLEVPEKQVLKKQVLKKQVLKKQVLKVLLEVPEKQVLKVLLEVPEKQVLKKQVLKKQALETLENIGTSPDNIIDNNEDPNIIPPDVLDIFNQ